MKKYSDMIKIFLFVLTMVTSFSEAAVAQTSKKEKEEAKMIVTKELIESQNFVFVPQYMSPLRGGTRNLTSYYDLQVSKDTLISYLPYFGRAYTAPLNSSDGGYNFTSTNFEYTVTQGKKKEWDIFIKPKDNANVQQLSLRVFDNSSASLNITGPNRDAISYQGYITAKKTKR